MKARPLSLPEAGRVARAAPGRRAPAAGQRGAGAGQRGAAGQAAAPPAPPNPTESGVWRSDDGGKTWKVVSNNNNRPMYYSQVRVDPTTDQIVYTMGASFYKSVDGGKTFRTVGGIAHGDHHGMWIDPKNPKHLILGNDGGLDVSYDQADTLGIRQHDRGRPVLRRQRRHAAARTTSAAACRTTAPGAARARSAARTASSTPTGSGWAAATDSIRSRIRPIRTSSTPSRRTET